MSCVMDIAVYLHFINYKLQIWPFHSDDDILCRFRNVLTDGYTSEDKKKLWYHILIWFSSIGMPPIHNKLCTSFSDPPTFRFSYCIPIFCLKVVFYGGGLART